jgi:hypothetical protein
MLLKKITTLGDDINIDAPVEDGTGASTFDQMQNFLDSSTGQNITANLLSWFSKGQGTTPVFKNPNGTFSTPSAPVNSNLLIFGAVALGLVLYFNGKKG